MSESTIYWYDLETFGLSPFSDRIAQFAGIRTNMDLKIIDKGTMLYCRLSPDYLPSPASCLITGITPQLVNEKGIPEAEFIARINREFTHRDTIVAGYNNIRFDDEFIRGAYYRNFFDPYEREYRFGCSRWDIIDLCRATHDLRPEGIVWAHRTSDDKPSLKLTDITQDNNIEQDDAHDALCDVKATIAVARLIKEKQPRIFKYALNHRSKAQILQLLDLTNHTPVLYTSPVFASSRGYTHLVAPLVAHRSQSNLIYAFDLSEDAEPLFNATPETILSVKGVTTIQVNKCPFISPESMLSVDGVAARLQLDRTLASEKVKAIRRHREVFNTLLCAKETDYPPEKDPDLRIYQDGFTTQEDKANFQIIRNTPPSKKLGLHLRFSSEKAPKMLLRHVARNWPEVLSEKEKKQWDSFCASHILSPPGKDGMSYEYYMRHTQEMLESTEIPASDKKIIQTLRDYGKELGEKFWSQA